MAKITGILRGVGAVAALGLSLAMAAEPIMETYAAPLDTYFGTVSSSVVSEKTDAADWIYQSEFKTIKETYEGMKKFAIEEAQESMTLLKNKANALPISKTEKITLMGIRAYVPVYGNDMGAAVDTNAVEKGTQITNVFAERGFQINPTMMQTYKDWVVANGGKLMENGDFYAKYAGKASGSGAADTGTLNLHATDAVVEASVAELTALNANYDQDSEEYGTAIVVVGRVGGESKNYVPGGTDSKTGNIFGLSAEEREIIENAKANYDKVIVLVNSTNQIELAELEADDGIDAIMWIGYPGAFGFYGVADVLNGTVAPSGHLGDIYAANGAVNPSMENFGNIPWANKSDFTNAENVNGYLINAEGIYVGYRYYETRYADVVAGVSGAKTASAGTYVNADGTVATQDGNWNYSNEVVYPFGYGLSYTEFEQTLDSVNIKGDKKTAEVTVTVKNVGSVAGKSVVQLYAQAPYIKGGVEKSAIQLMDYEKTDTLAPGKSQTITIHVDMANLASYDYKDAKTYILDEGTYYFAIGNDSHDALNNILDAQDKSTANGMDYNGDEKKTYDWNWNEDKVTFSVSKAGVEITNRLSEGESAMDINYFLPGTVEYMTRSNWNGTYPETIEGLTATGELLPLLKNDFYTLKTDDDTSAYKWGVDNGLTLADMKGASFDDPRWEKIVDQVPIDEFLNFAANAFHNIEEIPSVSYLGNNADDGPGGSDSHKLNEGQYQGVMFDKNYGKPADEQDPNANDAETAEYLEKYGDITTRVFPTPTNLAYSWNKELAYRNGEIVLGESTLVLNLPIMIGPGVNLHRHAYNGRGGEYYSEDPILSGYTGSAVVQGAQSKGCLVNVKHFAFNDQEINRSGVAVFHNEQAARELELRNFQQMFEANGKPASFYADEAKADSYTVGALGTMTSFNRIGAAAPSANKGANIDILRGEWAFKGYSVTDFTGVSLKAAPKESLLYGTTAFCGMGGSVEYWNAETLGKDATMCAALKQDIKYTLYALANSAAMNGLNNTTHVVQHDVIWRQIYKNLQLGFGVATVAAIGLYLVGEVFSVAVNVAVKKELKKRKGGR